VTEDEAKSKWCPMTRVAAGPRGEGWFNHTLHEAGVEAGEDRSTASPKLTRCIGSACMAWRWEVSPAAASAYEGIGGATIVAGGYCGLAGRDA
jgi:hypothetical protein